MTEIGPEKGPIHPVGVGCLYGRTPSPASLRLSSRITGQHRATIKALPTHPNRPRPYGILGWRLRLMSIGRPLRSGITPITYQGEISPKGVLYEQSSRPGVDPHLLAQCPGVLSAALLLTRGYTGKRIRSGRQSAAPASTPGRYANNYYC